MDARRQPASATVCVGVGTYRRAGGRKRSARVPAAVCTRGGRAEQGVVCDDAGDGLPAGCGECADVHELDRVGLAREQSGARADVAGEEQDGGRTGAAKLEREMARTGWV